MGNEMIKIQVVEDDNVVALFLRELLSKWGYNVCSVSSTGEKAILDFKEFKPNMLLVDIHLDGDMTGIDVVNEVKKNGELPVIYLTADLDQATIEQTKTTVPSAYLKKPFDENQLKATIEIAISSFIETQSQVKKLKDEVVMHSQQVEELTETNAHLITATFRERALKKELESSKLLIEEQSKKIHDSINYSLRIQQSIIPSSDLFESALKKHFVFYKPKDVVSGDFPWLYERENYVYYAAVDCTGHGVPGAMMSMIGNLLLNSIVSHGNECKTPSEILAELHKSVVKTLKQDAEGNKAADGMDAALCRVDFEKRELLFSGAHLPLFLLRNGELETYKGDKFPVGGMQYRNRNTYSDHIIQLEKGDKVFVFSDGIIDQVGGEDKMKWMSSRLKEFIVENKDVDMFRFKELIQQKFDEFKGDHKQVDDVLLIGVEF